MCRPTLDEILRFVHAPSQSDHEENSGGVVVFRLSMRSCDAEYECSSA
jgi:hypothetical protein